MLAITKVSINGIVCYRTFFLLMSNLALVDVTAVDSPDSGVV